MKFSKSMMLVAVLVSTHAITLFGLFPRPKSTETTSRSTAVVTRPTGLKPVGSEVGLPSRVIVPNALEPVFATILNYLKKPSEQRTKKDIVALQKSFQYMVGILEPILIEDNMRLTAGNSDIVFKGELTEPLLNEPSIFEGMQVVDQ